MGQRSQIYVRYNNDNDKKGLIANYYGWNYGERMISRARWGLSLIADNIKYYQSIESVTKLSRIFDVNFDMKDVLISQDIIQEYKDDFSSENFNDFVFHSQHNNDGKLLIDIVDEETIKYAFLDWSANPNSIMDGESYMNWDMGDWRTSEHLSKNVIKTCERNIKEISKIAQLMTKEEVEEFINYNYL